ncbi:DUF6247 family protein [Kribbella sp. CA-247076]|uniref:DUF6247 family protein n=1 Tax=Kribbella sp. CA-247076 TaxID=3239941 RepID=UPI003D90E345
MAAQVVQGPLDDPGEILRVLPVKWHEQFLGEYRTALQAARDVRRIPELRVMLRLWRLRAFAYSSPGFEEAMEAAREGRDDEFVPAEHVIPGWPDRQ